jgi:hypothetical protein
VSRLVADAGVAKRVRSISRAFADLERSLEQLTTRARTAARQAATSSKGGQRKRRTVHITPKRRAQLKLQGAYMGYMRQLKPAQKARVKAVKEKSGFGAAIKLARRIAEE